MTYTGVAELGGRYITFSQPTEGQLEMLARIQRAISRGSDDAPGEFWAKQISRLGDLLDALMSDTDRDIVEAMMIAGKISSIDILQALFRAIADGQDKQEPNETTQVTGVASPKRARRG
jgi:hypothetical protein